jgi:hypothetical protein
MDTTIFENIVKYEEKEFVKGASARSKHSGTNVVLVSNPTANMIVDSIIRVWVAMEYDTQVRYLEDVDDLILLT